MCCVASGREPLERSCMFQSEHKVKHAEVGGTKVRRTEAIRLCYSEAADLNIVLT